MFNQILPSRLYWPNDNELYDPITIKSTSDVLEISDMDEVMYKI
jgi:hypothetical protein